MPTFVHGKGAYFALSNVSGSTINLSSGIEEVSLPRSVDTAEVTSYGDNDRNYIAGLRSGTVSVSGMWNSSYETIIAPLLGSTVVPKFTFGPAGNSAGKRKETGSAILTAYETGASVGDKVTMKFDLQISGVLTSTTF